MIDADFMDLVWWVMLPLALLFALWAQQDCLRSKLLPLPAKFGFCFLILLVPIWGGIIWYRWKELHQGGQSALMRRAMRRRGQGRR